MQSLSLLCADVRICTKKNHLIFVDMYSLFLPLFFCYVLCVAVKIATSSAAVAAAAAVHFVYGVVVVDVAHCCWFYMCRISFHLLIWFLFFSEIFELARTWPEKRLVYFVLFIWLFWSSFICIVRNVEACIAKNNNNKKVNFRCWSSSTMRTFLIGKCCVAALRRLGLVNWITGRCILVWWTTRNC